MANISVKLKLCWKYGNRELGNLVSTLKIAKQTLAFLLLTWKYHFNVKRISISISQHLDFYTEVVGTQMWLNIYQPEAFVLLRIAELIHTVVTDQPIAVSLFQLDEKKCSIWSVKKVVFTSRMSSRGAQSSRQHALHPQGLLWMVEAEKGRLAKTKHASCQKREPCG